MTVFKDGTRTVAALDAEVRTILARLELVSGAACQSFDSSGGHDSEDPGGKRPGGDNSTPADYYRRRLTGVYETHGRKIAQAVDERARDVAKNWLTERLEEILDKATSELAQLTGRDGEAPKRQDVVLDTEEGIIDAVLDEAPGKPAEYVASKLGLTVFMVRRMYVAEGLDPHDGSLVTKLGNRADRDRRVREMAERGLSERQIRDLLSLKSTTTVRRALGRAA